MIHNQKIALAFVYILFASLACTQNTPTPEQPQVEEPDETVETVETIETVETAQSTQYNIYLPGLGKDPPPAVDSGGVPTSIPVDPHIEIEAIQMNLKVGEFVTVVGRAVDIGLPTYYLNVRDEGIQDILPMVQVTYNNQVTRMEAASLVLEFVSAEGRPEGATFVLHAKEVGITSVTISASGEVQSGSTGGATWSGGASGTVVIIVTD